MSWRKIRSLISNIVTAMLFINLIVVAGLVISTKASGGEPKILGYQLKTVLSGSMEPTFMTGSIIAVKPLEGEAKRNLQKGDVITFLEEDNKLITHRIMDTTISGEHVMYVTKGDNNNANDINPVLADNVQALYADFTIPYIGYLTQFAQSKEGSALLLIGPGLFLLLYAAFSIYQGLRLLEPQKNPLDQDKKETPA